LQGRERRCQSLTHNARSAGAPADRGGKTSREWQLLRSFAMAINPCAFAGTEFPPRGGPGGSAFRSECPPGQYMVGARWRSGYWLDQISITCAPVDATGLTGSQWHGPTFGGNGGSPHEQSCPPGSILRLGMPARYPDNHFVNFIDVSCYPTTYNYTCCTAKFPFVSRATCEMTDDRGVVHKGTHWVCRYKPPGNINTTDVNVLKQQVHAPTCER
jgi:hypothetical protein